VKNLALPKKREDGRIHAVGELVVASRDIQTEHFHTLKPVLDAVGSRQCLMISPLQRYIVGGCCQDVRHVANRLDRGYQEEQKQQLALLTRNLKGFLFNNRRPNVRVVDTMQDLIGFDNADMWCVDPVHHIEQVYRRIAGGVLKMAANQQDHDERVGEKRRRQDGQGDDTRQRRRGGFQEREDDQWRRLVESQNSYRGREGRQYERQYDRRSGEAEYSPMDGEGDFNDYNRSGGYEGRGRGGQRAFRGHRRPYSGGGGRKRF
jgi:hypothetical protein